MGNTTGNTIRNIEITRVKGGTEDQVIDTVVEESPLTIYLNERELVTLLCTPENHEHLAIGFLYSEGLIHDPSSIVSVSLEPETGIISVRTSKVEYDPEEFFQKRTITSGCGRGALFQSVVDYVECRPVMADLRMDRETIFELFREFQKKSTTFRKTGGVHSCALVQGRDFLAFAEDIGRHNAVDKIIGRCFLEGISLEDKAILTSGRLSSEIVLKLAKRGVPIIISRSAPTALAVDLARKLGITLIGFVRGNKMNIYSHEVRVARDPTLFTKSDKSKGFKIISSAPASLPF